MFHSQIYHKALAAGESSQSIWTSYSGFRAALLCQSNAKQLDSTQGSLSYPACPPDVSYLPEHIPYVMCMHPYTPPPSPSLPPFTSLYIPHRSAVHPAYTSAASGPGATALKGTFGIHGRLLLSWGLALFHNDLHVLSSPVGWATKRLEFTTP